MLTSKLFCTRKRGFLLPEMIKADHTLVLGEVRPSTSSSLAPPLRNSTPPLKIQSPPFENVDG